MSPSIREAESIFLGGGEMGALMRALDWSKTPLGVASKWPQSLRTSVSTCLDCAFPILLWWGPELVMLYNDEYVPILGSEKHPMALGSPGSQVWPELWEVIGPMLEQVMSAGQATRSRDLLLLMNRYGYQEETYFSFSYSPIRDESGGVGGVFTPVIETTAKVVGERRLRTLRELAAVVGSASVDGVIRSALDVLSRNKRDVPFALFYSLEGDGSVFRLKGSAGPKSDNHAPPEIRFRDDDIWPLGKAFSGDGAAIVQKLYHLDLAFLGDLVRPEAALVVPIVPAGRETAVSVLVAGVNPLRPLDEEHRSFFDLVAGQIGQSFADALMFEEERRRAVNLAELDRAKTQFFSNVSHEFRTPLALILGPLEQLLSQPDMPPESVREMTQTAHRNGMRLLKLVNTLLDFSRIEGGRVEATYAPVDLTRFTTEISSAFRYVFERAGLDFALAGHALEQPVYLDRDLWEKVVLNLLSNAFKFTLTGGVVVTVQPTHDNAGAELIVADTGVGIPEAELPRLFERFHRVENSGGRSYEGSGIGLALVRELVELHGGTISVESRQGMGSTFAIRLPFGASHLPADRVREASTAPDAGAKRAEFLEEASGWLEPLQAGPENRFRAVGSPARRVLFADDNPDMRQYVTRLLTAEGYKVETANDGEAALRLARMNAPDLVLADIMMPTLDGLALLKALRAHAPTSQTPVILLSARAGEEEKVEGLQTGADDYLVKPFSSRELLARVQAAIRLAEARRSASLLLHEESLRVLRLLEQAPSFICVLRGPNHVFEFANLAYRRLVGGREIIGRTVLEAVPEAEGQGFIELLDRVYAGERFVGQALPLQLDHEHSGTLAPAFLDFVYEPIVEADGTTSGVFVEGYEVTARVHAEQALRRSEEQLRLATDAAEVALWDLDGLTGDLYWPASVKAMFGIAAEVSVTVEDFYAGLHPEDREAITNAFQAAADPARRLLYDVEYRTVGKEDGKVRWVAAKGRGVFDDDGRCVRVIGTALDITKRKADEARLRELNASLERRVAEALAERKIFADVVEGTDSLVLVVDLDLQLLAINKAGVSEFERVYGVRPKVGASLLKGLEDRPEHATAVRQMWGRALAGEIFSEVEEFGDPSFDRRAYEIKFNPLRDASGVQIGAFQFVTDVTHRVCERERLTQAEEQLRQSQKMEAMGQLTGGVAHDFNNLLMPIIGSLDMIQRKGRHDPRIDRMVDGALQAAERAKTLVQRLLAFARRQPLQPRAVDVGSLIKGMADLVVSTSGPRIRVQFEVSSNLPAAVADPNQLEMALLNLAVNGRDAMPEGGSLTILAQAQPRPERLASTLQPGLHLCISIADTGVGMDAATLKRATEPFFSTKGVGKGTGLGLSMAHGLAAQLGGTLTLQSEPGRGTTVEMWLPITEAAASAYPNAHPVADLSNRSGTALLVDDEDIVRSSTSEMLSELGYHVIGAESAEAARALIADGLTPDVLITDHLMPGMTGLQLITSVRERLPQLAALIISGYAELEGVAPQISRLTKPFRQQDLAQALAKVFER